MSDVFEIKDLSPVNTRRGDLLLAFLPFIKYMARRLVSQIPPHIERGDLVSAGVLGLIDAIRKYDPSRDNQFKTYAEFRIRGAMLDEVRSYDWVSKTIRQKTRRLGIQDSFLHRQILEVYEDWQSSKPKTPYHGLIQLMQTRQLEKAIEALPKRQKWAITLYYFKELNMKEIGKEISVTESAISLLLTQARKSLRLIFKAEQWIEEGINNGDVL